MLRMASKQKQETNQLTFAEIAEEKKRLADQQAELDRQLASAKDAEFAKVTAAVEDFNAAFGEFLELKEKSKRTASGEPRKCRTCGGPPHRKKNCPGAQPQPISGAVA